MADIAYKSQGAGASTETSGAALSPLCPATVDAGDILLAHVYFEGTATTPSTPSGWTLLSGPHVIETTIGRMWLYGKIADGSEDGAAVAFGTPAVTTMRAARVYSAAGRINGTITQLVTQFAFTSNANDPTFPTVATQKVGARAFAFVAQNDNNTFANATGESGGDWVEAVAEYTVALTPGFSLGIQTCVPTANPGTVSGGSDNTLNDPAGVLVCQIQSDINQTVSPSAIATAEAFGTAKLNLKVSPSALASAEAFGTASVNRKISGAGNIATAEAFGTAVLTQGVPAQTITPSAIASAEALGTLQLNLKVSPSGVATTEAFGTTKVNQRIDASGIASAEAVGTPSAQFRIGSSGIASLEAFGTAQLNLKVSPSTTASAEAFGTLSVNQRISPTGIASEEAVGTPAAKFTISASGVSSSEAFGAPQINLKISPSGISSDGTFGTAAINLWIAPSGVASAEAFGTASISAGGLVVPGIPSQEAFGTPKLNRTLPAGSISSAEAFGAPTVYPYLYIPEEPSPEQPPTIDDSFVTLPDGSRFTRTAATGATGPSPIYSRVRTSRIDPDRVRIQFVQDGAPLSLRRASVSVVCHGKSNLSIQQSEAAVVVSPMLCPRTPGLRHRPKVRIEYLGGRVLWIPIWR